MARSKAETKPEELPIEEPVEPAPEELVEAPKPRRTRKQDLVVVEYFGDGEGPVAGVEKAAGELAKNGELIVSVPKVLDGDSLTSWLRSHGFDRKLLSLG